MLQKGVKGDDFSVQKLLHIGKSMLREGCTLELLHGSEVQPPHSGKGGLRFLLLFFIRSI